MRAVVVRELRGTDVAHLAGVLSRAYQSRQNFALTLAAYLRTRAVATFVADLHGEPVGIVIGNDYGSVAYVAQMGVDPIHHRRGIGSVLMDHLMAWAEERGFSAVELDATPAGAPLYARYGFREISRTLVFDSGESAGGASATQQVRPYTAEHRDGLFAADRQSFGADRSDVLRLLVASPTNAVLVSGADGCVDGYAVAQVEMGRLGPVIAPDPGTAAALIDAARRALPATHLLSVPSENIAVQTILGARGYRLSRPLAHMVCGTSPSATRSAVYARISLGQG